MPRQAGAGRMEMGWQPLVQMTQEKEAERRRRRRRTRYEARGASLESSTPCFNLTPAFR